MSNPAKSGAAALKGLSMTRIISDRRERLYVHSNIDGVAGRYELPAGLVPNTHTGPRPQADVFRAMGQTKVIVIAGDRLPPADSARAVWEGQVSFDTEHELSREHARWDWILANSVAIDRDNREVFNIAMASLESKPAGFDSNRAIWSVEFIFTDIVDRRSARRLWGW